MSVDHLRIEAAAAEADLGRPSARKGGHHQRWPYVPLIVWKDDNGDEHERQLRGLAYATREEAVARAERHIAAERAALARKLAERPYRALREHYGLPREVG